MFHTGSHPENMLLTLGHFTKRGGGVQPKSKSFEVVFVGLICLRNRTLRGFNPFQNFEVVVFYSFTHKS